MRILVLAFLFLTACATTAGYEKILSSWVGQSSDHLISSWGPPASVSPLSDGGKVLEYSRQRNIQIGGYATTTPVTTQSNGMVTGDVNAQYTGTSTTYVPTTTPVQNIAMSCVTRFTVNAQGTITNWSWQGNDCKARAPKELKQQDVEGQKKKLTDIVAAFKKLDAESLAICAKPEYASLMLKSPCISSDITFAQLADNTKLAPEQKDIFLKYRTEVDAHFKIINEFMHNDGFTLDSEWADYLDLSVQPEFEKYNLDLYKGNITWGDYNQLRKNLTDKLIEKRKEMFPQSK